MSRRASLLALIASLAIGPPIAGAAGAPPAVAPGAPGAFATIAGSCPTFSWGAVEGAEAYELVVYEIDAEGEPGAPALLHVVPGSALTWTPSVDRCFQAGGRYAWAVRAKGAPSDSAWSATSLFRIADAPSLEEVAAAVRILHRYLEANTGQPSQLPQEAESIDSRVDVDAARSRTPAAGPAAPVVPALPLPAPRAPLPGAPAPTPGPPALGLDGQLHLGADSHLFKEGSLLLWEDGSNLALGADALASNSNGARNTAVGSSALLTSTLGNDNVALGADALSSNVDGNLNVASGRNALRTNTAGSYNVAVGSFAMYKNETAVANVAVGNQALRDNTTGFWNSAVGADALLLNTTGSFNVAVGTLSLLNNTYGNRNVGVGVAALLDNTTGDWNVALGADALQKNTTGAGSFAAGYETLFENTEGDYNVAVGHKALHETTTGARNTAIGVRALHSNSTGTDNVAVGYEAGYYVTGGNNVLIANDGTGVGSNEIRIGTTGSHDEAFLAGIGGAVTGTAVYVDATSAKLGTALASSRELKEQIREMGEASKALLELRPVTFRYRPEVTGGRGGREFGLIAEEVAEVLPDLVVSDRQGRPRAVRYQKLVPLLLNELQQQERRMEQLERRWELALAGVPSVALAALLALLMLRRRSSALALPRPGRR